MISDQLKVLYNKARIDDRQVNELIGLARGIAADGGVNQREAEYLYTWLAANKDSIANPLIAILFKRVGEYLSDGVLDSEEANDLLELLKSFSGGDIELGEALRSTTLPLCDPAPVITFSGKKFCFTGEFGFGKRDECEAAVVERGAAAGNLVTTTNFLVVGMYASDAWAHSNYGRKIEKAVEWRAQRRPIHIVSESHWLSHL